MADAGSSSTPNPDARGATEPGDHAGHVGRKGFFHRLYAGTGAFDIVGKRKRFYLFFGALVLICLTSIVVRGFHYSIEFEGGTQIQLPAVGTHGAISPDQAKAVYVDTLGQEPASVQLVGTGGQSSVLIRSDLLDNTRATRLETALFQRLAPLDSSGKPSQQVISDSTVSASWGAQISEKALIGLLVFLVLVTIFLAVYFDRWMAAAALVALVHDVVVTAGVYSIVGFQVTPATVIGLLTILGFSLYDTVVVFDKVRENTRGLLNLSRQTYAEAANLALNQTLMRSINTSLIALLPVLGLLIVGVGVLGVGTLQDLALVQLIGLLAGTLSSICLATPLVVDLTMRRPAYQQQAQRVYARRAELAKRAATRPAGAALADADSLPDDDDALAVESRREKAYAAAAGVPARTPKAHQRRDSRGSSRSGRPSGKKRH